MIWRDILCRQPVTEIERRYTRIRRPSHVGRRGAIERPLRMVFRVEPDRGRVAGPKLQASVTSCCRLSAVNNPTEM